MGKNTRNKMLNNVNKIDVPNVERHFGDSTALSFEKIVESLIKEKVDQYVNSSYHDEQVNVATSIEGVA